MMTYCFLCLDHATLNCIFFLRKANCWPTEFIRLVECSDKLLHAVRVVLSAYFSYFIKREKYAYVVMRMSVHVLVPLITFKSIYR
jgi:hypothetical protein